MLTTNNVRGEHLLWLTPILYIWLANITAPNDLIVFYMDDSYYLFNFFTTMLIFLCIVMLPYYLHTHLRKNNIRNIVISWLHILFSSVLILAILSILTYIPPINRNWRYSPVQSPHFSNWILFNDIALVLFGILLFIQIVYLIYGFSKIRKHKEQIKYNQPEVEVILYNRDEVFINPAL